MTGPAGLTLLVRQESLAWNSSTEAECRGFTGDAEQKPRVAWIGQTVRLLHCPLLSTVSPQHLQGKAAPETQVPASEIRPFNPFFFSRSHLILWVSGITSWPLSSLASCSLPLANKARTGSE